MEQIPSWEDNRTSVKKPRILWNPEVHYRILRHPANVLVLSQIKPVYTSPFHLLKVHFIIIVPSTLRSSKWSLSIRSSHQNLVCISPVPQMSRAPPILLFWIWPPEWYLMSTEHETFLYVVFSTPLLPCPLRPMYLHYYPSLRHPLPMFLLQWEGPGFTFIQNNRKNYSSVRLVVYIFG